MYEMVVPEDELLTATQRYFNLVKSVYTHGELEQAPNNRNKTTFVHNGTELHFYYEFMQDTTNPFYVGVYPVFHWGDEIFMIPASVERNKDWDKKVINQEERCVIYDKDQMISEFLEFAVDYFPDFCYN